MVKWLRPAVVSLALAAIIALSGVVLGRIFADALLAQLVAGAAVGSVAVCVASRRLPASAVSPLSVVLLAAYTVFALRTAAVRADLAEPLPQIVRDALVNGIPRLLTAMIPVEPTPDTVVVPVVGAWLAGLAGAEIALRAGRVLLGIAPPAMLYAGVLYVVGPNAGAAGWPTLAFAGLAVAALAISVRPADTGALREVPARARAAVRGRALARAAGGLALLLGLVAAVGPWVGARVATTPVDPRRYVQPPQVDSLDESPLNRISGWALTPGQRLLEVSAATPPISAKAKTVRLRLAVLPDYDGVTWRVGATYRNAGRVLPAHAGLPGAEVHRVRQDVTVDGLTGRLLPVLPTPTDVTGARVAFDPATGTLIRPEGLTTGLHYRVTSEVESPDLNALPTAQTPSGDAVARYLAVGGGIPEQIQRLADQLANGEGAPYDRAAAIESFLAEHYRRVADAPSGHAYPNLAFFLFGPRDQGGQVGTSEQFAASFALLARLTGLPSRLVVGFDAPAAGGTVTGGDAIAWPEILFDGLGWVAFDPMPKSDNPRPVEEDFTPKPTTPTTAPSDLPTPSENTSASATPSALAAAPGGGPSGVVVASSTSGSIVFVLAVAAAVIMGMRRALTRRRLTEGGPDERITGAWAEFTDALRLAGRPVPPHLAATEAAAYASAPEPPRRGLLRRAAPAGAPTAPEPGATAGRTLAAAERPRAAGGRSGGAATDESTAGRSAATAGDHGGAGGSAAQNEDEIAVRPSGAPAGGPPREGRDGVGPAARAITPDGSWAPDPTGVRTLPRPSPAVTTPASGGTAAPGGQRPLPPLDYLVAGINTVGFAPGSADATLAEWAGLQVLAYAAALRERRSWWRRVWWRVRPGPLRWQRRR